MNINKTFFEDLYKSQIDTIEKNTNETLSDKIRDKISDITQTLKSQTHNSPYRNGYKTGHYDAFTEILKVMNDYNLKEINES